MNEVRLRDGRRLSYAEYGSPRGAPIVHCHGAPSSHVEGEFLFERTLLLELGGSNQEPSAPEPRPVSDDRIWPAAGVDELTDEEVSAGLAEELAALSETTWGNRQN